MDDKISIVTVCYNAVNIVEQTICSVLKQDYSAIEYIIIDGGSSDGTIDIIKEYEDKLVYWISEPDKGVYDAMNKGIGMVSEGWICFMNAGDVFVNNHVLTDVVSKISKTKDDIGVIYGDCICQISIAEKYGKATNPFFMQKKYVPNKGFCHQSSFVRADIAKHNMFNLKYKICGDFQMMWSIYNQGYKFKYVPIAVARYEVENGISKKHPIRAFKENAEIVGVDETLKFKFIFTTFIIKQTLHDLISNTIKILCPPLFNYIKKRTL